MDFRKQFIYKEVHNNRHVEARINSKTSHLTTEDLMNTCLQRMPVNQRVEKLCADSDLATCMDRMCMMSQHEEALKSDKLTPDVLACAMSTVFSSSDENLKNMGQNYLVKHFKQFNEDYPVREDAPRPIAGLQLDSVDGGTTERCSMYLYALSLMELNDKETNIGLYNLINSKEMGLDDIVSDFGQLMSPNTHSKMLGDIMKIGPRMTSSPELCREMFIAGLGRKLNSAQIARIFSYLVCDGVESRWDISMLIDVMKKEILVIDWNAILRGLDNGFMNIASDAQYKRLCAVLGHACVSGVTLSPANVFAPWTNTEAQFSIISKFIERRDMFDIVSYSRVLQTEKMKMPFSDYARKNIVWGSIDMVCCLLGMHQRAGEAMQEAIEEMFTYPMEYCPDLLFTALIYSEAVDWLNRLKMRLMVSFIKIIAKNKGLRMYLHHAMTMGEEVVRGIARAVELAALANPQLFEIIYMMTCNLEMLHDIRFSTNIPFNLHYNRLCLKHDEHFTAEGWLMVVVERHGIETLEQLIKHTHSLVAQSNPDLAFDLRMSKGDKFVALFVKAALRVAVNSDNLDLHRHIKELFTGDSIDQPQLYRPSLRSFPSEDVEAVEKATTFFNSYKSGISKLDAFIQCYAEIYNRGMNNNDQFYGSFVRVFMTLLKDEVVELYKNSLTTTDTLVNMLIHIYLNKYFIEPIWSEIVAVVKVLASSIEERKFQSVVAANYVMNYIRIIDGGETEYFKFMDYITLIVERSLCLDNFPQSFVPSPPYVHQTENFQNMVKHYQVAPEFVYATQDVFLNFSSATLNSHAIRILGMRKVLPKPMVLFLAYYIVVVRLPQCPRNSHLPYVQLILLLDKDHLDFKDSISLYNCVIEETLKYRIATLTKITDNYCNQTLTNLGHWLGCLTMSVDMPFVASSFDMIRMAQLLYTFPSGALLNAHVIILLEFLKASKYSNNVFSLPNAFVMVLMKLLMLLQVKGRVTATIGLEIDSLCIILSTDQHNLLEVKTLMSAETQLFDPTAIFYVHPLQITNHGKLSDLNDQRQPRYRGGSLTVDNFTMWKSVIVLDEFVNYEQNLKKQIIQDMETFLRDMTDYYSKHLVSSPGETIESAIEKMNKNVTFQSTLQGGVHHTLFNTLNQFYNMDSDSLVSICNSIVSANWRLFDDMVRIMLRYSSKPYEARLTTSRGPRVETDRTQLAEVLSDVIGRMECSDDIKGGLRVLINAMNRTNFNERSEMMVLLRLSINTLFLFFDPSKINQRDITAINQFMVTLFNYLLKESPHQQAFRDNFLRLLWEEDPRIRRNMEATLFILTNFVQTSDFDEFMANSLVRGDPSEYSYMITLDKFLGMANNPPVRPLIKSMNIVRRYQEIPLTTVPLSIPLPETFQSDADASRLADLMLKLLCFNKVTQNTTYEQVFQVVPEANQNEFVQDGFISSFTYHSLLNLDHFVRQLTVKFSRMSHPLYQCVFYLADCLAMLLVSIVTHRTTQTQSSLVQTILSSFVCAVRQPKSHPMLYQRFLMTLFRLLMNVLEGPDGNFIMSLLCQVLDAVKPLSLDKFSLSFLSMVSNRMFVIRYLNTLPEHWSMYSALLGACLKYTQLFTSEYIPPFATYYKMTCELLHMLVRDRPEFLSRCYMQLVVHINVNAHQLFQYVTSAQPRDLSSAEIRDKSRTPLMMAQVVNPLCERMRPQLDTFLSERKPVTFLASLKDTLLANAGGKSAVDFALLSPLILYIGVQAIKSLEASNRSIQFSSENIGYTPHTDILQHLLIHFDYQEKYLLVVCLLNNVRFPSRHTEYFSSLIIHLYVTCESVRDLIILVLIKRIIVFKPHSVGFMELFVKLTSPEVLNQPSNKQLVMCLKYYRDMCHHNLREFYADYQSAT